MFVVKSPNRDLYFVRFRNDIRAQFSPSTMAAEQFDSEGAAKETIDILNMARAEDGIDPRPFVIVRLASNGTPTDV